MTFDGGALLFSTLRVSAVVVIAASLMSAQVRPAGDTDVTRATLDNGLRVVIVRDPLAPVVTVEQNYLVGGNETPAGFPGMAHAQEHMAFRGCSELSADQISAIFAQFRANPSNARRRSAPRRVRLRDRGPRRAEDGAGDSPPRRHPLTTRSRVAGNARS